MMVIFYEEYHRELLHLSNISVTTPEADRLLPFLDAHQIAEAKKKVEQGMAPFLGVGTSAMLSAGTGATTSSTNHAGHVPMPRPSLLQDVQGAGAVSAPPDCHVCTGFDPLAAASEAYDSVAKAIVLRAGVRYCVGVSSYRWSN